MDLIAIKCNRDNLNFEECYKKEFFGIYDNDHSKFHFSVQEEALISKIVLYIENVIIDKGADNFSLNDSENINWSSKWYFETQPTQRNHSMAKYDTQTHRILYKLLETADSNAEREPGGYRFDSNTKNYASFFRMIGGPLGYTTAQRNMPLALPALVSTNRYIARTQHTIIEGELRCNELREYLNDRELPLIVSLSEDATRIVIRIQYDARTNQLIGFVLPLDINGMPIPFSFKALYTEEIIRHFTIGIPLANFVITIIAKPH